MVRLVREHSHGLDAVAGGVRAQAEPLEHRLGDDDVDVVVLLHEKRWASDICFGKIPWQQLFFVRVSRSSFSKIRLGLSIILTFGK